MCWKRLGWPRGHQGQFCTTGSWAAVRQKDAGGTGRRAGCMHNNSWQRENRQFLLQCCKEMAGQRWWYPAHITNCQKWNNIANMSEIHQYIAVHTSMYQYIPVYTSTYYYALVHTSTYRNVLVWTSTYLLKYVQVQRGIYQYILVCTSVHHVLVHTRTYQYVLVWRKRYWWQYIPVYTSTY